MTKPSTDREIAFRQSKVKQMKSFAEIIRLSITTAGVVFGCGASLAVGSSAGAVSQPLTLGSDPGVFIFTAGPHTSKPACSTVGNDWAVNLTTPAGRSQQALVMLAYAMGKSVGVAGKGVCDAWSDRETPGYLWIID
jgi:hypothetical protein